MPVSKISIEIGLFYSGYVWSDATCTSYLWTENKIMDLDIQNHFQRFQLYRAPCRQCCSLNCNNLLINHISIALKKK